MIEETYAVLATWDFERSKRENLDRLREENFIGASSTTWLRDVAKVLNRRFQPEGRDRALVVLAKGGCDIEVWKPILLWHITRDEFLLGDFLRSWLFPLYDAGAFRVRPEELHDYLRNLASRGATTEHDWSDQTLRRVAAGLLKISVDFGLLQGGGVKEFTTYHLPEQSFLYLLHALQEAHHNPSKVVNAAEWRMFLMRLSGVEQTLLRLHQFRKLEYHAAGSLVQLELPCDSALDYAERMVT